MTRRNALRRQAGLPLLDVRTEFRHAVALAVEEEINTLARSHDGERQRTLLQVRAEFATRHPTVSPNDRFARMWIGSEVSMRFRAFLLTIYGRPVPVFQPKHVIRYGGGQ